MFATSIDTDLFLERVFFPGGSFFRGLLTTVYIAVLSQVIAVFLGLVAALALRAGFFPLRLVSTIYVLVFRGTPLIVQIFFVYFGANLLLGFDVFPRAFNVLGLEISGAVVAGVVALSLNEGAYMSEIIRAGISAIDRGQIESAQSVGMTKSLAMRRIVLPQAARVILPPLGNEFNTMIKSTSLLAFIGVYEMFLDAQIGYSRTFRPVEYFAAVAIWYLVLTTIWSLIQVQIERSLGASERGDEEESLAARLLGPAFDIRRPA